uniref:Uncharacterized protein n=1 Tax=Tanacetum cinerariifolium TaxID=118510 RepID=A0A6L2JBH0_TANCI|nr:hypothetical protein [Tanacetum cinerariifolium]
MKLLVNVNRLSGWKAKALSIGGRLTLVKFPRLCALDIFQDCKVSDTDGFFVGPGEFLFVKGLWRPCCSCLEYCGMLGFREKLIYVRRGRPSIDYLLGSTWFLEILISLLRFALFARRRTSLWLTASSLVHMSLLFGARFGHGGASPSRLFSHPSVFLDISLSNVGILDSLVLSNILNGVLFCAIWAIKKWQNNIVFALAASLDDAKNEDIFPTIQRLSMLWISVRCKRAWDWSRWISNPRLILDYGKLDVLFLVWERIRGRYGRLVRSAKLSFSVPSPYAVGLITSLPPFS